MHLTAFCEKAEKFGHQKKNCCNDPNKNSAEVDDAPTMRGSHIIQYADYKNP